ncbi:glycosyltransferase [Nitrosomonas sp. Nm34]|uniref:glycosyltransferase family 4 protein n=1 Tax=Nitrosomonas sp. Nm34 TaxID=1881055 RepID=UPI0015871509|nr:glycosyltransferase [Nitrosomonas sp. Nm34]
MQKRPRLAYISPLPPEQSGISDYSAELLPELAQHYEIEVIVMQSEVSDDWVRSHCPIRDVAWFRQHASRFDRVLYHFGNSLFHIHMFDLLPEFPGVVVLHDFFLSGVVAHLDVHGFKPHSWAKALAYAHGWRALQERYLAKDPADVVWAYPCNLEILEQALGVIVHAEYSRRLAKEWYGEGFEDNWVKVPHLRVPLLNVDRKAIRYAARLKLGLAENDLVICSFGFLGPHKLNHKLLSAWLASPLASDLHCRLVFVGENYGGEYGNKLVRTWHSSLSADRIEITGWAERELYRTWLAAADIGVQLRDLSRGETSGTVLDCMNYGLATIVNAHGSMADLPVNAVWMLPDKFADDQLIEALTTLWHDSGRRNTLGKHAREVICNFHQPRHCAKLYTQAIEDFYNKATRYNKTSAELPALVDAIADADTDPGLSLDEWSRHSSQSVNNFPPRPHRKQLLLDISELVQHDAESGIQHVLHALLRELLRNPPEGWTIEPVYATKDTNGYCYAHRFASQFLEINDSWAEDMPVNSWEGDIFLGLDLQSVVVSAQKNYLLSLNQRGIKIYFVIYDLSPILLPQIFLDDAEAIHQWGLKTILCFDGAICISRAVADQLYEWLQVFGSKREQPFVLSWLHQGSGIEDSAPALGTTIDADQMAEALKTWLSLLLVGTTESHKGRTQMPAAFELLWSEGSHANLVIVGKQEAIVEASIKKLRIHPELGKHLFWLAGVSDKYLEKFYAKSACLIEEKPEQATQLDTLDQEILALVHSTTNSSQEKSELMAQHEASKQEVTTLIKAHDELRMLADQHKTQIDTLTQINLALKTDIKELVQEKSVLMTKNRALKKEVAILNKGRNKQRVLADQHKMEIDTLTQKYIALKAAKEALIQEKLTLTAQYEVLKQEMTVLSKACEEQNRLTHQRWTQIDTLTQTQAEQSKMISQHKAELEQLKDVLLREPGL